MENIRNSLILISLIVCLSGVLTIISCKKENPLIKIPTVTTGKIFDISDNTAVCDGYIISNGGSPIIKCGVSWGIDSTLLSIEKTRHIEDLHDTGNYTSSIIKLIANTTYFVKAYASNRLGTGYGKVVTFTTGVPYANNINFNSSINYGSLIDQDGNTYKTVTIGGQVWMAENLKVITYNNGVSLTPGTDYFWYNNDIISNKATYGAFYSWTAVNSGKLCPATWHVPSENDWLTLALTLDPTAQTDKYPIICNGGGKLKEAGTIHWISPNTGATNESGFTALPGGDYICYPFTFDSLGFNTCFWSSTWLYKAPTGGTTGLSLNPIIQLNHDSEFFTMLVGGFFIKPVRCIKN